MPRIVYMNSDLIENKQSDLNFLNSIGKTLDFYGVPYRAYSYETSPHYAILKKAPSNAVIMHNSLMCPGTILDVCSVHIKNSKTIENSSGIITLR